MQKHIMMILGVRGRNAQTINAGQTVHVQEDDYDVEMETNGRVIGLLGQL